MKRVPEPITTRLVLGLTGVMVALLLLEQAPELQRLLEPVNLGLARATEWLIQRLDLPVALSISESIASQPLRNSSPPTRAIFPAISSPRNVRIALF